MSRLFPGRTFLPNGDSYSRFTISPSNWETPRAVSDQRWYIKYRYYPFGENIGKQRMIKGTVNEVDDLTEKQLRMRALIQKEKEMLHGKDKPVFLIQSTRTNEEIKQDPDYPIPIVYQPIEPEDSFKTAVLKSLYNPSGCDDHVSDLRRNVIRALKLARILEYDHFPIKDISRKHLIRMFKILKDQVSAHLYNRTRAHMISVFEILQDEEATEINPARKVPIQPMAEKKQTALSINDINRILVYLKVTNYNFYRFLYIFYHTGSRPVELCRLRYEDVNLSKSVYTVTIFKKKKKYKIVSKPIHNDVMFLWQELMREAKPGQFLFGHGFKPGPNMYKSTTYSTWFKTYVKDSLGIQENFYTLKHRKLSELREYMLSTEAMDLSRKVTQEAATHDSFSTTELYLGEEQTLINTLLKSVKSAVKNSSTDN